MAFDEAHLYSRAGASRLSFGAYESCGKCTPCRFGSGQIEEIFARYRKSDAMPAQRVPSVERNRARLEMTSLCGHGTGLGAFAESVLRYYRRGAASCFA